MGLLERVKETAGKVGEQAKELADSGRGKVDELMARRRIEQLEREIGCLVVARRRGEAPDDSDARIDTLVAEITDIEAHLASSAEVDLVDAEAEVHAREAEARAAESEARAVEEAVGADTGPDDADSALPHGS